ncbi:MAG: BCCT family transporter, partial [Paeniglutamicibacter terrestris]
MAVNTDEHMSDEPDGPDTELAEDPETVLPPPDDTAILQELKDSELERKATRMIPRLPEGLDKVTFGVAGVFALAFVIWGLVNTDSLSSASNAALSWVTENTGWFFVSL